MKRCTRILMALAALVLLSAPCAFAAPESAAPAEISAPSAGPEGAPVPDISPVPDNSPAPEALPAGDLSAGDVDESFTPPSAQRLTLVERLSLQNAVCALWHNSMKQNPAPVEDLDPMVLEAPDHIFVQGAYFTDGGWVFEGVVRQMTPDSTGIEVISAIQHYRVKFQRKADGGFKIVSVFFGEMGMG